MTGEVLQPRPNQGFSGPSSPCRAMRPGSAPAPRGVTATRSGRPGRHTPGRDRHGTDTGPGPLSFPRPMTAAVARLTPWTGRRGRRARLWVRYLISPREGRLGARRPMSPPGPEAVATRRSAPRPQARGHRCGGRSGGLPHMPANKTGTAMYRGFSRDGHDDDGPAQRSDVAASGSPGSTVGTRGVSGCVPARRQRSCGAGGFVLCGPVTCAIRPGPWRGPGQSAFPCNRAATIPKLRSMSATSAPLAASRSPARRAAINARCNLCSSISRACFWATITFR